MPAFDSAELRAVLSKRGRCLGELLDEPTRKPELQSRLDVSRSTVDYAVRELLEFELIDRVPEGFRATLFGELAHAAYVRYDRMLAGQCVAAEVLAAIEPGHIDEPALFEGAEVVLPDPAAPDRPLRRFLELVEGCDGLRGFSPVVLENYVDVFHNRIVNDGMQTEVIITREVLGHLASTYAGRFREVLEADNCTIYESTADPAFGLVLLDLAGKEHVGIVVHDGSGIRGFVVNDGPLVREWGEQLYLMYRKDAEPVFVRGPTSTSGGGTRQQLYGLDASNSAE